MSSDDLQRAERFFAAQLRNVANPSPSALRRWARIKLRTDTNALARLMMAEGYKATYLRYFIKYHISRLREALEQRDRQYGQINEEVLTALADIRDAARRLPQPFRDLAAVCFRYGYINNNVIQKLANELEREGENDSKQRT
jgi:uncharacterized protein (UPF0305 family)